MTNSTASIQARLKNIAEKLHRPFAEVLQYYGMERFLYRLSKSDYVNKFVLKGGLLIHSWDVPMRRPTRDMDFRGYLDNSEIAIMKAVKNVITTSMPGDGIVFDADSVKVEQTQIDADYAGIRVRFTGYLDKARIPMQIDIGFSDELASRVERIDYPTLLDDMKAPRLKGYPKESIVAEKFHAMIRHAELNSRFKDYYDVWLIADNFEFDSLSLRKALEKTFSQRQTVIPNGRPAALTTAFASDNAKRWENFLQKTGLEGNHVDDFVDVLDKIWTFVEYPLLPSIDPSQPNRHWTPHKGWKWNIR